jgi:hypothetical protein
MIPSNVYIYIHDSIELLFHHHSSSSCTLHVHVHQCIDPATIQWNNGIYNFFKLHALNVQTNQNLIFFLHNNRELY